MNSIRLNKLKRVYFKAIMRRALWSDTGVRKIMHVKKR